MVVHTTKNSGVAFSCLSYAEAKASTSDFNKAPFLTHPSSRGDGGHHFRPYTFYTKLGEKVTQATQLQQCLLSGCLSWEHKWASKDMPWLSCCGTEKGTQKGRTPACLHYSHCQNGQPGNSCRQRDGEIRLGATR